MRRRSVVSAILVFLAGFVLTEGLSAALGYHGIFLGPLVVRYLIPQAEQLPATLNRPGELGAALTKHASLQFKPVADWGGRLDEVSRHWIIDLYGPEFARFGMHLDIIHPPSDVSYQFLAPNRKPLEDATILRWKQGPTCHRGRCAIDVLFSEDNIRFRKVLSVRAAEIGVGITITNGVKDLVVDGKYLFVWDGSTYVGR